MNLISKIAPYAIFLLAIGTLRFFFELRYFWYTNPDDAYVLNMGFGIGVLLLSGVFLFLPLPLLGGAIALAVMLFPQAFPELALQVNGGFIMFLFFIALLVVGSIEYRRRSQLVGSIE